jgi:hypothetical protein
MLINLLPKFKIVEINNVAALRMGHVIAQTPAYVDGEGAKVTCKEVGDYKFVENGLIVGLDGTNVLANYDATKHSQPCLIYTEELITANLVEGLDQFAELVPGANKPVYPRALPLNLGDTFTTNNVAEYSADAAFATVDNGVLKLVKTRDEAMFAAKASNLPAGQQAIEFTYIGLPAKAKKEANAGE